ncbi:MAG: DinB family protein [Nitrososphaerales archaeon]
MRKAGMATQHANEANDEMLRTFLRAQRESVLAIVEGLSEEAWHRSVVPTGWTPAGMLEHLSGAEWHWFQGVVAGKQPELQGDLDEGEAPYDPLTVVFTSDASSAEVTAFYRHQCAESEAVLATSPLSTPPRGKHDLDEFVPPNVRWVVLHMIEETARHAGHLDLARELLDGKVRLGGR